MTPYNVAVYDLAQKIARTFLLPACMLTQAIYPHNVRNKDRKFAFQAFAGLFAISAVGLIALYFLAPWVVSLLGNDQLNPAIPLLRFFEIYILVETCSIFCGTPLLVAWGHSKPFNDSVFISTAGLLLMYGIFWCLNINSVYFFATALLFSELIIFVYRAFYCVKNKIIAIY
jgi:PST family polysaccharide transporter